MIKRFEIITFGSPRPDAERIIFCDGTDGSIYHDGVDLELSHWKPNRTPAEYRAGTSTEICFRFLDHPREGDWTAAVNNHIDVDGILSMYVLMHSEHALAHRQTIIQAAEMGDFWGWGEPAAQRVFQGLTRLMEQGGAGQAIYEQAFQRIPGLIDATDSQAGEIDASLTPLREGVELIETGRIQRRQLEPHFTHFIIPLAIAEDNEARAGYAPQFNEAISMKAVLWPHARNCWDAQRVCLVSVERSGGWFHDLCFPGYLWADTVDRWQVPGLTYHDGMSSYDLQNSRLLAAYEDLQQQETAAGRWSLGGTSLPFGKELQSVFPIVGRFLNEQGQPAKSRLPPEQVAQTLQGVID